MPLSDYTGGYDSNTVNVNGVKLTLKEFDMRTRALWLDVAEEFGLTALQSEVQTEILPKLSNIGQSIENDPRVKSVSKRQEKLLERHDKLLEVYGTDEESDDIDKQLEDLVQRMEGLQDELDTIRDRVKGEVLSESRDAEKKITELVELQDKARVYFVWKIASTLGKTELDFDDFYESCDSGDYEAADRFLTEGNAPWASLYTDRMRPNQKKKRAAN